MCGIIVLKRERENSIKQKGIDFMSIFKKKEVVKHSRDYNKFIELLESLNDIDFQHIIKELLTLEYTLKFYEKKSPDWQCEMDYYKCCQYTLLCKIGTYDGIRRDIIELLNHTKEEDCKNLSVPLTSHEEIRNIVKYRGV